MNDRAAVALVKLSNSGQVLSDQDEDIRGLTVKDRDGSEVGKVEDLLIDPDQGKVRMLQLEHGGILGIGATATFVPVEAVTRIGGGEVHIDQTRDRLADAPRYDPELTDQSDYYGGLYGYYGYAPFWAPGSIYPGHPL